MHSTKLQYHQNNFTTFFFRRLEADVCRHFHIKAHDLRGGQRGFEPFNLHETGRDGLQTIWLFHDAALSHIIILKKSKKQIKIKLQTSYLLLL